MVINDKNKFSDALQASSKTFALREMKLIFFGFKPAMSIKYLVWKNFGNNAMFDPKISQQQYR